MKVEYNPKDDTIGIEAKDDEQIPPSEGYVIHLKIPLEILLDNMPDERARVHQLLDELYQVRKEFNEQLGNYNQYIVDLVKGMAKVRQRMEDLDPVEDAKAVNTLEKVMKAYSHEKNTIRESRHALKFLTFREGKILADLEKLEV